ncbi:MAG TPA: ABC transporter permease [Blastocatellia bacterium]|nr:ABC transporter permease [Blastocatellia bacterium]HMZ17458.1 ABC transporter permease [Blastocatellia bacterium]HNG28758.1 ABC transporter permease [Blastocatellia bacterium]
MKTFRQDLQYGMRMLRKNPGFTLVAIITLALGIGANTTIFSVINSLLLKPVPFPEAERLVLVWQAEANNLKNRNIVSAPNYWDWQRRSDMFEKMAILDSAGKGYNLSGGGEPERVSGVRVSADFFDVLGVKPRLGRAFTAEEEQPGKHQVVIISDGLWRNRYNSDPDIIGKTVRVEAEEHTVVGVMPPDFEFSLYSPVRQLWVPVAYTKGDQDRTSNSFLCLARLKSGVTVEQARARMNNIGRALAEQYPQENAGRTATVDSVIGFDTEEQRKTLLTLLGVAGFVLLIACVNVANLLMARGAARGRELAIRTALGAGRARIIRQLLTESLLLALAGGLSGMLIAVWSNSLLLKVLPEDLMAIPFRTISREGGLSIDYKVLAFTWAVTCLTGVIFGLAPALIFSRRNVNEILQESSRGATGGGGRLRQGLVMLEVALALVVLTGAGLMIQSMARLLNVAPGFDPHNVLLMGMSLPQENTFYGPPGHPEFPRNLQQFVGGIPGVVSVSAVSHAPIGGGNAGRGFVIEGRPDPGSENQPGAKYTIICPNYFQTMRVKLRSGREFTEQDSLNAPGVIVINETMAKRFWPDEDPLGKRIKLGLFSADAPWLTVVGVAADVKQGGLDRTPRPEFFRPYNQAAWPVMTVIVRTASSPRAFIAPVKQALAKFEPDRAPSGFRTMEEVISDSLGSRRFPMMLLAAFSVVALTLAAVGISGVVSFAVSQRTREIGIRMALGAQKSSVIRLVLTRSMTAALLGIAVGVAASVALTRFLAGLLFEVKPLDPLTMSAAALILTGVALLACYLPARRAAKVDPMIALRCD